MAQSSHIAESPHIAAVTQADFQAQVLERSRRIPVLVDFWAAWCAPCRMLEPVLERLVEHYDGRLFLAKVNTDEEQALAQAYGIRGIPALKLFRHGRLVGELVGVQPESTLRELIDRHLATPADDEVARAAALAQAGEIGPAIAALRETHARYPDQPRVQLELARLLARDDAGPDEAARAQECRRLLDSLPIRAAGEPEVERLRARVELLEAAAGAPPVAELEQRIAQAPDDSAARLRLGARLALAERYEAAMEQLLELVRRDRAYGDDAGRKALLAVFALLGPRDPLVAKFRAQLSRVLN